MGRIMGNRRDWLKSAAALVFSPFFLPALAVAASARARAFGDLFILDGWVLTRADLRELDVDAL